MIQEFADAWGENQTFLRAYLALTKQEEYDDYEKLFAALFNYVINPYLKSKGKKEYVVDDITKIDNGNCQGTLLFLIPKGFYQPNYDDYVISYVWYGSCSGCDTLMGIHNYITDVTPDDEQLSEYMQLCLNMLQRCKYAFE